jgi:hypothetical protein
LPFASSFHRTRYGSPLELWRLVAVPRDVATMCSVLSSKQDIRASTTCENRLKWEELFNGIRGGLSIRLSDNGEYVAKDLDYGTRQDYVLLQRAGATEPTLFILRSWEIQHVMESKHEDVEMEDGDESDHNDEGDEQLATLRARAKECLNNKKGKKMCDSDDSDSDDNMIVDSEGLKSGKASGGELEILDLDVEKEVRRPLRSTKYHIPFREFEEYFTYLIYEYTRAKNSGNPAFNDVAHIEETAMLDACAEFSDRIKVGGAVHAVGGMVSNRALAARHTTCDTAVVFTLARALVARTGGEVSRGEDGDVGVRG